VVANLARVDMEIIMMIVAFYLWIAMLLYLVLDRKAWLYPKKKRQNAGENAERLGEKMEFREYDP